MDHAMARGEMRILPRLSPLNMQSFLSNMGGGVNARSPWPKEDGGRSKSCTVSDPHPPAGVGLVPKETGDREIIALFLIGPHVCLELVPIQLGQQEKENSTDRPQHSKGLGAAAHSRNSRAASRRLSSCSSLLKASSTSSPPSSNTMVQWLRY